MRAQARENHVPDALPDRLSEVVDGQRHTGLYQKTTSAHLGDCHAFFSHSWRDDGVAKYAALQRWAQDKTAPTIWLDKACIDQTRIDENLAALPIFLSGCQTLLVVAGKSYSTRLWCVMECFTFLYIGGDEAKSRLLVYKIGADVENILAAFNAKNASCYHARDRDRLLGIVESSSVTSRSSRA